MPKLPLMRWKKFGLVLKWKDKPLKVSISKVSIQSLFIIPYADLPPAELIDRDNFKRLFTSFAVFTARQATGATAFAYFGPQYFKLLVGGGSKDLLLTAVFGAIKVAACGVFVLFLSNRIGRRKVLIAGAAFMAACQVSKFSEFFL
jgi:MFS family permease